MGSKGSSRRRLGIGLIALLLLVALTVAACGGGSGSSSSTTESEPAGGEPVADTSEGGETVSIDVGEGMSVEVPKGEKPKIGFFSTSGNTYVTGMIKGAEKAAKENGASAELLDSQFDATKQYEQLQNALQSKKYNAWVVTPFDEHLLCNILSKEAPEANILVAITILPVCGRGLKPAGEELWQPGTLTMVGGENTVDYKVGWVEEILEHLGPNEKVALVTGPTVGNNTETMTAAIEQFPELQKAMVAEVSTDFTTPDSLAKTQTLLKANPDITAIISLFSDTTRGIVEALKEAGMSEQVKVFDIGASSYAVEAVEKGEIESTIPYAPVKEGEVAVESIVKAFEGQKVPRFIDVFPPDGSVTKPLWIDKSNAAEYQAEY